MFKLQRQNHRPSKSGERVDFKFSNFQALQVPKGWDRLFLSMTSVESGKTVARLGKALVRNGNCQWTETLLESVWITKDDSSKEPEECLFKLVVSMGSSRAGILGEATINVSCLMSSKASSAVILPLRKCNFETLLQVKIQCLTPRPNIRHGSPNSNFKRQNEDVDFQALSSTSETADNSLVRSSKVSSSQDLDVSSHHENHKDQNYSGVNSNHNANYAEGSKRRDPFNPMHKLQSNGYTTHQRHIGASSKSSSAHDNYPVDDSSFSSQSSCNSGVMNSKMDLHSSGKESGNASPRNTGSKDLLEAAEGTIEELRVEAKMWERNARKLMLDLDMLRKEFLGQSKKQSDLVMELSAAYAEHSGLKKEIEQLNVMLEESTLKQRALEDSVLQSEGQTQIQEELESELKYHQQSNANLSLQLKRSQESNIELVSILQELEHTIEQQKIEIENLSALHLKSADSESSVEQNLGENRNLLLQFQQLQESGKMLEIDVQRLEKALEEKVNELETQRSLNGQSLLDMERVYKYQLSVKDEEITNLQAKVMKSVRGRLLDDMEKNSGSDSDLIKEIESLREKVHELETDCNELTEENLELLLKIKESENIHIGKCGSFSSTSSELPAKSVSMQSDVSDTEPQMYDPELKSKTNEEEQCAAFESSGLFCELLKQLELAFHCLMKPLPNVSPHASEKCKFILDDVANLSKKDSSNSKVFTESILNYFSELNNILEDRIAEFEQTIRCGEIEIQKRNDAITEAHKSVEDMILKVQQHEISKAELEADCQSLLKELSQKRSEMDKLQADLLSKEGQTNFHIQRQRELEIQVADLQTEKVQLEMNNETIEREHEVTSKCLDDLQNDFAVLSSRLDSHVSAKEILERKLAELELEKRNLEKKIILLEDEKLQLQERISVMDVQMTQLGDEQQSCRLELKDSKSLAMNLQNQIRRLEIEMEAHNVSFNQNIQDKQDQLLESQRHCECLRAENQDLQASILRLGEERKILQKLNKELKKKELELHEHSEQMATRLENSEKCFSDCTRKVEALEENLNSTLEAFTLKEKSLNSELEAFLQECRNEKEKLVLQETLSNQMHFEMSSEVKNLQKEVESLMTQISVAHEEKEKAESEASLEIASLNADKRKLEFALQEVNSKLELSERELNNLHVEFELKAESMRTELSASEKIHVIPIADHEKLLKQLASRRTTEEKLKTALNNIELKLTLSDYENQQLREESANLKVHFQRVADLQHEVSVLKSKVEECRFEKEKLEASYQTVSGDYESLKAEKNSCVEKVLSLQKAMTDYEDCKQKAIALEEKLLQMEGALLSKETLSAQNADLEKELNEVRKVSKQYQQIISQLEEQKSECLLKVQALEMDVLKRHNCDRKCDGKCSMKDGSPRPGEVADELAEALDEDNMHKIQLHSFSSEELSSETMACSKISVVESQAEARERFERTKSSLETELRDLRERYLEMSLKYAEVEAQREDLVMKLKAAKSGKRWFS
nr:paramyosin-like isoform X2 [Coffea arabica]XP_027072553.1 paramyosin-like isoform X2 [Coffea arabica]